MVLASGRSPASRHRRRQSSAAVGSAQAGAQRRDQRVDRRQPRQRSGVEHDLDAARRALGYERVDLLSESAGTRTAMIYAWRYPKRIHRSVMIGVNPPGNFLWDAKTTGVQIERYAALCANDPSCRARTPDLATFSAGVVT